MSPRIMFEQELEVLKNKVAEMGERAILSYDRLLYAVKAMDRETMRQLLDNDRQMIDMLRSIEARCLTLLTRQQPVARDLRVVSASLKVVTDIERIGDHVSDMAELFLRMEGGTDFMHEEPVVTEMMNETREMLHMAVEAFVQGNTDLARKVIDRDDVVDDYFNRVKDGMMEAIRSHTPFAEREVDKLMIGKYLEKIGDHAVNMGEWAIFQKTGDIQDVRLL